MRARRMGFAVGVVVAASLLAAGCGGDPPGEAPAVAADDPGLAARVRELLPTLEERSGLERLRPVRVERRDRESLRGYLEAKLDEELPPEEARSLADVYGLLGLLPDDVELRALLLSIYTEQVAGFYDPDSTALFLVASGDSAEVGPVLVHELVHALQDQHVDLDSLTASGLENDRRAASHAVIEGHATLVMFEQLLAEELERDVDLTRVPSLGDRLRPALEEMNARFPALSSAPRIIREGLIFPYLGGAAYVQAVWSAREGRPAPFGELLPRSTEQVMHPGKLLEEPADEPTPVEVRLVDGGRRVYANSLGEMEVAVLLEDHLGAAARGAAAGWDGDRYVLVERPDGARSLVWYGVWDDAEGRDRLVDALSRIASGLPTGAGVEAVEIDSRPGVRLRVGPGGVETAATLGSVRARGTRPGGTPSG